MGYTRRKRKLGKKGRSKKRRSYKRRSYSKKKYLRGGDGTPPSTPPRNNQNTYGNPPPLNINRGRSRINSSTEGVNTGNVNGSFSNQLNNAAIQANRNTVVNGDPTSVTHEYFDK